MSNMAVTGKRRPISSITFLIVLLLDVAVFAFIAQQIIAFRDYPFDIDEANHANSGLALYLTLQDGDLAGFVREFYGQEFYPPGVSWILAVAFALFGASAVTARLFSAVSLFLAVLVMFGMSLELDEKLGWLAGLTAVTLTLSSQTILVNATLAMIEMPGLLITLLWLWAYIRAIKQPTSRRLFLASLLLAFTFLTKYTFGVIAVASVIVMELSQVWLLWLGNRDVSLLAFLWQRFRQRWLWLLGPFVLVMLVWLGYPAKLVGFLGYTRPLGSGEPWLSARNLLFYPRSLALHYLPAPLFVWVLLAALLWAAACWRVAAIRLLLIYFLAGMALIVSVNHPPNQRFIATVVPAAHLLIGLMVAWAVAFWQRNRSRWRTAFTLAGIGFLALVGLTVPIFLGKLAAFPSLVSVTYETTPRLTDMAAWLKSQIPDGERFYLINYWDQFSPQTLAWYWGRSAGPPTRLAELVMPGALLEPASPQNVTAVRQDILESGVDYLVLVEGSPWGVPFWSEYTAVMSDNLVPVTQEKFALNLYGGRNWLANNLLQPAVWEQKKAESAYTLDIQLIVYRIER